MSQGILALVYVVESLKLRHGESTTQQWFRSLSPLMNSSVPRSSTSSSQAARQNPLANLDTRRLAHRIIASVDSFGTAASRPLPRSSHLVALDGQPWTPSYRSAPLGHV